MVLGLSSISAEIKSQEWHDYRMCKVQSAKCKADLNFDVNFGVNGAIGTIVAK